MSLLQYIKPSAFVLLILVVLPPQQSLGDVKLSLWFHSGRAEERASIAKVIEEFNKRDNGITVEVVQLPEGSYNEQVQAAALAGDLPDILDFDGPNVYNYAWSGYLIPLGDYLSDEMKNDFLPSILAQARYNGKLYNLGSFDSGLALWGNKAYLEKAGVRIPKGVVDGWDQREFLAALEKLKALPEVDYPIDFKMNYGVGEWFTYGVSPILQSFGGDLIDRSNFQSAEGVLNGADAVKALTFFQSLFQRGFAKTSQAGDDDFYGKKSAALSYVGHWAWQSHHKALGDNLILLPIPVFGHKPVTGMGSWTWGITSSCKHPKSAWAVVSHLLSPNSVLAITDSNGAVPSRKSAIAQSKLYAPGGPLRLFADQLERGYGVPRPQTPAYPVITAAFAAAVQNIVSGADVQTELDKAVKTIDQDIADNHGYPTE